MKGIVFSLSSFDRFRPHSSSGRKSRFDLVRFFRTYGIHTVFVLIFFFGVIYGSLSIKSFSPRFFSKLDFLFVTNMTERLNFSAFSIFCSSLASGFLFIFAAFLMAFSAWGMAFLPILCAFRGFGVGISSAYLFLQYSLSGIGFYILVILPGTVLFLFSFIIALKESFGASVSLFKLYFFAKSEVVCKKFLRTYIVRNTYVLMLLLASALMDMLLWMLFANLFKF